MSSMLRPTAPASSSRSTSSAGRGAVAGLHVGGDRDVRHGRADAAYAVEGVVERHVLVVALAAGVGQRVAADAQRARSRPRRRPSRTRRPRRWAGPAWSRCGGARGAGWRGRRRRCPCVEAATREARSTGRGHRTRAGVAPACRSTTAPTRADPVLDSRRSIGAGQAGLAASYFLRQRGIDHLVLDANPRPGGAWQHRWASLSMDDVHGVADLPGVHRARRLAAGRPTVVVPDYFDDYERVARPPRRAPGAGRPRRERGRPARRARRRPGLAHPDAGQRDRHLDAAVRAATTRASRRSPASRCTPRDYPGAEHFRGRRVLVVGGGASAVQFLGELAPGHRHAVGDPPPAGVARRRLRRRRRPRRGHRGRGARTTGAAAGERRQRDRPGAAAPGAGGGPARAPTSGGSRCSSGSSPTACGGPTAAFEPVDVILWATGFRPAVDHLAPLGLRIPAGRHRPRAGARQRAGRDHGRAATRACSSWATAPRPARSAPRAPVGRPPSRCRGTSPRWPPDAPALF